MELDRDLDIEKKTYVPPKVREFAKQLVVDKDVDACMERVRQHYKNLHTRRSVLVKIRACIIEHNVHDDDYERQMKGYEDRLGREYSKEKKRDPKSKETKQLMDRLLNLYQFRGCDLKRQIKLKKKMSLECKMCDERDRKFFSELVLLPEWLSKLQLTQDEQRQINTEQHQSMVEQASNVVKIEDAESLVIKNRQVLRTEENDIGALAAAIALCTGRRMVEVLLQGDFAEHPDHRYSVFFRGQVKSGLQTIESMQEDKQRQYAIPTLATGSSIVRAVSRLRGLLSTSPNPPTTSRDVNASYCKKLNTYVKASIHPELTFHSLRTMYALMTFEAFKPHRYSLNMWIANTLGHCSMSMSVNYTRMQIYGLKRIARQRHELCEDFNT